MLLRLDRNPTLHNVSLKLFNTFLLFEWNGNRTPKKLGFVFFRYPVELFLACQSQVLHRKSTWTLKTMVSNRNLLFQGSIFRCHVSFLGGSCDDCDGFLQQGTCDLQKQKTWCDRDLFCAPGSINSFIWG